MTIGWCADIHLAFLGLSYALLILRGDLLPSWVAWLGFLAALVHIVGAVSFASSGWLSPSGLSVFVAPPLYYLWILAASALLLRRPARPRPTT
jgi:hypothetical protein